MLSIFCTELGLGYSAGGHRNRFEDIKRVRLSNRRLETRLLPRLGSRSYCIVRVILRRVVGFLHLTWAVRGLQG
eukprot:7556093-Pyramimonas_sp.AAC.1